MAYIAGLKGGRPLLERYGPYIMVTAGKPRMAYEWFEGYGHEAVLISRMLPVIRTFISLPAGIARMNLKKFVIYTFAGSLPWCLILAYWLSSRSSLDFTEASVPCARLRHTHRHTPDPPPFTGKDEI
ncbi:DedA family protein [Methanothermobacter sp.]|uniref:DedA family protein n=1 Tax=Methanothermobacter sp. TaxID=1884223 RepID=UPI00345BE075